MVHSPQILRRIGMAPYIYQHKDWPNFTWNTEAIATRLAMVRHHQGRVMGKMENLGFNLQMEANLFTLTLDVLKSNEIEGELLNADQVRSSIARKLGIDMAGLVPADRSVEGIVEMMLDATQHFQLPLTHERLFEWHANMFPDGKSGHHKIVTGNYRDNPTEDPMVIVSGPSGRERIHYKAPDSALLHGEMTKFLHWFNTNNETDPVLKSAIAHLWFVTIHPFDDGNGRIARAIADMQLCRADHNEKRFYSMSSQIRVERKEYYAILEATQGDTLDITGWIEWFLNCLDRAIANTDKALAATLKKAKFWEQHASTPLNSRQVMMLNTLMDDFKGKLTSAKWAKMTKTSQDTAGRDINDLMEKGILVKEDAGRSTAYRLT